MTLKTPTYEITLDEDELAPCRDAEINCALAELADAGLDPSDISANWQGVQIRVAISDTDDDGELPGEKWEWTGNSNTDNHGGTTSDARLMIECGSLEEAEALAAQIIAKL